MTREVQIVGPETTLQQAAKMMATLGVGALPICSGRKLVGLLTDRDIVVRAVANGATASSPVANFMTSDVAYAYEDEDAEAALHRMRTLQIRRLAVLSRDSNIAGILALGDIATESDAAGCAEVGQALAGISDPSRPRN